MTNADDIQGLADGLRQQLRDVYRVRGRTLAQALRRSGRLLPKPVRRQGDIVARAEAALGNPKLEPMIDTKAVRQARDAVSEHLDSIDVADLRRGRLLGLAGVIVFNLIVTSALFVLWLVWSGHL